MEESKQEKQPHLPIHEDTPEAEHEQQHPQQNQPESRTISQQMAEA